MTRTLPLLALLPALSGTPALSQAEVANALACRATLTDIEYYAEESDLLLGDWEQASRAVSDAIQAGQMACGEIDMTMAEGEQVSKSFIDLFSQVRGAGYYCRNDAEAMARVENGRRYLGELTQDYQALHGYFERHWRENC